MSFKSLVNKLVKEGKSREAATKIAGKVANAKLKGAGSGPTAKQKARMKGKGSAANMKKETPLEMSKKRELIKSGYSRKTAKSVAKSQKKGEKTRAKLAKVGSKARAAAEKKEKMQPFIDRYGEAGAKKGMKAEAKAVKKTNKAENKIKSDAAKAKAKRTKKELKQSIKQAKGDLKTFKRTGINLSSPANNKEKRATKQAAKAEKKQAKAEAKSFKKFAKSVKKSVKKASKSSALNFQAYDQMDTWDAKQTAGSPMGMYGKHSPANAYGKSPMNMSGQSYDAKEAYNKNLTASARLHYLENNRADAKAKKGGHSIHKHMGGRR